MNALPVFLNHQGTISDDTIPNQMHPTVCSGNCISFPHLSLYDLIKHFANRVTTPTSPLILMAL